MRSIKFLVIGLCAFVLAACQTVPIKNYTSEAFPPGARRLSMEQIEEIIIRTGAERDWRMTKTGPGALRATYAPRTHVANVMITFSQTDFSITYESSSNLRYDGVNIHHNYNRWVNNLRADILQAVSVQAALAG